MRAKILLGLAFLGASILAATDRIHPLDVKFGLWEITGTVTTRGRSPVPPEDLSKLTLGQRSRLAERMKARIRGKKEYQNLSVVPDEGEMESGHEQHRRRSKELHANDSHFDGEQDRDECAMQRSRHEKPDASGV